MRQFDLAPLYRNTVGFDRLFSMLDQIVGVEQAPSYPPYNIERTGENAYRISVAVAGFTEADLVLEVKENTLTIRGSKQAETDRKGEALFRIDPKQFQTAVDNAKAHFERMTADLANRFEAGISTFAGCSYIKYRTTSKHGLS